jgi:hypothetical protein
VVHICSLISSAHLRVRKSYARRTSDQPCPVLVLTPFFSRRLRSVAHPLPCWMSCQRSAAPTACSDERRHSKRPRADPGADHVRVQSRLVGQPCLVARAFPSPATLASASHGGSKCRPLPRQPQDCATTASASTTEASSVNLDSDLVLRGTSPARPRPAVLMSAGGHCLRAQEETASCARQHAARSSRLSSCRPDGTCPTPITPSAARRARRALRRSLRAHQEAALGKARVVGEPARNNCFAAARMPATWLRARIHGGVRPRRRHTPNER